MTLMSKGDPYVQLTESIYTLMFLFLCCYYAYCTMCHVQPCTDTFTVDLYFFLSILLIMAFTSTGADAAAALAFSCSSCCHRTMG